MAQQPLRFGSGRHPFDQIAFATGFLDGGFATQFDTYHFELTVMVVQATDAVVSDEFVVFVDGPSAHGVRFKPDGRINATTLGPRGSAHLIGHWAPGVPVRLVVDIDRPAEQWTIALDGTRVFTGLYPIDHSGGMRMLRPSAPPRTIAAIDDVIVQDRAVRPIDIDIKPGSDVNPVHPFARGMIAVAVLGSDTFDVLELDVATLRFGPGAAAPVHRGGGHFEDVDGDGLTDLLLHFSVEEIGIAMGDTSACLAGQTLEGTSVEGCDQVATTSGCGFGFELALVVPAVAWVRQWRRQRRPSG